MKLVGLGQSVQALLATYAAEMVNLGASLPTAQYVAAGEIPWDGESFIACLGAVQQGVPGKPEGFSLVSASQIITFVSVNFQLIRSVGTVGIRGGRIGLPTKTVQDTEGARAFDDAGYLFQAAVNMKAAGSVVPLGIDFAIGQVIPIGPEGGLSAVRINLDVSIDGV